MSRDILEAYQRADGLWVTGVERLRERYEHPRDGWPRAGIQREIHMSLWFGARCATIDPKMLRVTGV